MNTDDSAVDDRAKGLEALRAKYPDRATNLQTAIRLMNDVKAETAAALVVSHLRALIYLIRQGIDGNDPGVSADAHEALTELEARLFAGDQGESESEAR